MFRIRSVLVLFLLLAIATTSFAQECEVGTGFIQTKLQELTNSCEGVGRNQICYGTDSIQATPSFGVEVIDFDSTGDVEEILNIGSITMAPLTFQNTNWATALLLAQAVLPNSLPGQVITILLTGDVQLIPLGPDSDGVQSFSFSPGIGRTVCTEFSLDGLFIQTASTTDRQAININGARVELSSLAFVSGDSDDEALFQITMMNGHSWVNTEGSDQKDIGTGEQLTVYETGPADKVQSLYYQDPYVQTMSEYMTNVYGHCTLISRSSQNYQIRVGPGENRSVVIYLPEGNFQVIGKNVIDGEIWWRINKDAYQNLASYSANEMWVRDETGLEKSGDCESIPDASAPPIIAPAIDTTEYHPTTEVIGEVTEEPFYAQIDYFWADPNYIYYDISLETEACTTVYWSGVFGGHGAELYVQDLNTNEYWPVTADENGNGYHDICLEVSSDILLIMFTPNGINDHEQETIRVYVNE